MSVIVKGKNANKPHTVRYWVDGKQRERSFATAREARDFKIKTDHDVRAQIFVDDKLGRQNFGEAASVWLGMLAKAPTTKAKYASALNAHILPTLGNKTIAQVANDRDGVSSLLSATGDMSQRYREQIRFIIVSVLDECAKAGKIASHRIGGIELASRNHNSDHKDFVFPTHGQLTQLANGLNGTGLTIWLMRGCGLRIGEALAVKKSDFRDNGKTLRISEQISQQGESIPMKHRKPGDHRDVPVPGYLWVMVKNLSDGYLFHNGQRIPSYRGYLDLFRRKSTLAGIPDTFTPHSLRHAFVSALLTRGVAITDVASWVGHRDISVTFSVYGHLIPSAAARAANVLDAEYSEWSGSE